MRVFSAWTGELLNSGPMLTPPILAITNSRDHAISLLSLLAPSGWTIQWFSSCHEGLSYLDRHAVRLVLCESKLTDGTWRTIMEALVAMENAPLLAVFPSRADTTLVKDALNVEGFQVLLKPFDHREVENVIRTAVLESEMPVTGSSYLSGRAAGAQHHKHRKVNQPGQQRSL